MIDVDAGDVSRIAMKYSNTVHPKIADSSDMKLLRSFIFSIYSIQNFIYLFIYLFTLFY